MTAFDGLDPVGFVVGLNLRRRHLNARQRAWVAAKLATLERGGDYTFEQTANLHKAPTAAEAAVTREQAASMLHVSVGSARYVIRLHDDGVKGGPRLMRSSYIGNGDGTDHFKRA